MCKRNYLIDVMRTVACFGVVSIHFGRHIPFYDLAVPIFMMLAIYYSSFKDGCWLKSRIWRIYCPFAIWGFSGFVCRSVAEHSLNWKMLWSQLVFGAPANSPLYFMMVLIVCTLIIYGVCHVVMATWRRALILAGIMLTCLILQYCNLNGTMWKFLPLAQEITMGRVIELLPSACAGFLIALLRGASIKWRIAVVVGCCVGGLCFRGRECDFMDFNYGGLSRLLLSGSVFAITALAGESVNIENRLLQKTIISLSSCTAGVYYMHKIVGEALTRSHLIESKGILLTLVVFSLSTIVAFCVKKTRLRWMVA